MKYYEVIYTNSINNTTYKLITSRAKVALYEYLKALNNKNYNLNIYKNLINITQKINKMIEKNCKMIEKL